MPATATVGTLRPAQIVCPTHRTASRWPVLDGLGGLLQACLDCVAGAEVKEIVGL